VAYGANKYRYIPTLLLLLLLLALIALSSYFDFHCCDLHFYWRLT
jgi:hypothetical protein